MLSQGGDVTILFVTKFAFERLFTRMSSRVACKISRCCETLGAITALERLILVTGVHIDFMFQIHGFVAAMFTTILARMRLLVDILEMVLSTHFGFQDGFAQVARVTPDVCVGD